MTHPTPREIAQAYDWHDTFLWAETKLLYLVDRVRETGNPLASRDEGGDITIDRCWLNVGDTLFKHGVWLEDTPEFVVAADHAYCIAVEELGFAYDRHRIPDPA